MGFIEMVLFLSMIVFAVRFIVIWYGYTLQAWPWERGYIIKAVLLGIPLGGMIGIYIILRNFASFDVVNSPTFIFFYFLMGITWMNIGTRLMAQYFDLSWQDDVLGNNNKAALYAFIGGFVGFVTIFAAANMGSGPGWWTVVFAGGLGTVTLVVLGWLLHLAVKVFERITVERCVDCGIRTGFFLFAAGIILGRASAGDWTSAWMTVVEFGDGWPVLPLTVLAVLAEKYFANATQDPIGYTPSRVVPTLVGLAYVIYAVVCVILLPPLPVNPIWPV